MQGRAVLAAGHRAGGPLPGGDGPGAARRLGLADAQPFRADRDRPPQPAHQAGRHRGRERARSGRACPASSGTRRCCAPRRAARCSASTRTPSNEYGRLPLLVTRTFGAGKVLFMGTDGAWRWRKGVEDKYHYRFWGQVVRWMAYQRNMAKGETDAALLRARPAADEPDAGPARQRHGPLAASRSTGATSRRGSRRPRARRSWSGSRRRATSGASSPAGSRAEEPGSHKVSLFCKQTGATLETTFFVQGVAAERPGRPARPEVLEELARVTGGKVIDAGQARPGRPLAGRAARPAAVGAPDPALVAPGRRCGADRASGRLLGRPEGHRSCIVRGWDRRRRFILARTVKTTRCSVNSLADGLPPAIAQQHPPGLAPERGANTGPHETDYSNSTRASGLGSPMVPSSHPARAP